MVMATLTPLTSRLLAAGSFAVAVAAAPLMISLATPAPQALADDCPDTEVWDETSGACQPISDVTPATQNPINPENAPMQPGSITEGSGTGNVGQLGSVDGIPCTGANTGECIGLQESQGPPDNVTLPPVPVGVTP